MLYYLHKLFMYYILLFIHIQYILCNVYCNTNTYESAYMYTVGWDAGRISQQEIGLVASPNMYYVIVYPVRNV